MCVCLLVRLCRREMGADEDAGREKISPALSTPPSTHPIHTYLTFSPHR